MAAGRAREPPDAKFDRFAWEAIAAVMKVLTKYQREDWPALFDAAIAEKETK